MENIYYHHAYFGKIAQKLPKIALTLIILCWLPTLWVYIAVYHSLYLPLVKLSMNGSMMVIFMALLLGMILRELTKTVYIINDDGIIKKTPYKIRMAHFQKITSFEFHRFPFGKGVGKIVYSSGVILLPFIIHNLAQCIDDIQNRLDPHNEQPVYDRENIMLFKQKALTNDTIIAHAYSKVSVVLRISLWLAVGGALVARYYWGFAFQWVIAWCVIGYIFPIAAFLTCLGFMAKIVARTIKSDSSALQFDATPTYRLIGLSAFLLYVLLGIILKNLVMA